MATQTVAQSVPGLDISGLITPETPFWAGNDSMVAPHLPVGSPQRTALFNALRETFVEDWTAAEEAVIASRLNAMGDLYFITAGDAVKIGRTSSMKTRLRHIQTHNHEEITLAVHLKGQGWREKQYHREFRAFHLRGEWYARCPEIEAEIERLSR